MNWKGKKVLITGGASGIGKIMGRIVLEQGAQLIMWDVNSVKLDETSNELKDLGNVDAFLVDVSDHQSIQQASEAVIEKYRVIDVLINNAGIVVGDYFGNHTENDILKTMEINSIGPMLITKNFLPAMLNKGTGHICNIASSAGLIANPKMSVYVASKWAIFGWSESLRLEMRQLNKAIYVTTIAPYYISTGMFDGVKSIVPILKPKKVAVKIIRSIEKKRKVVAIPWPYRLVRWAQGILPLYLFDKIVGDWMGIYNGMSHFKKK